MIDRAAKVTCLQEVIPTDQSSSPLTPNPQRLKDGLAYSLETENNQPKEQRSW